jgi:serine/threonine-protein kinase HipA
LPDERARRLLASALGVSEGNPFGLLEIIGGECAGALSLHPQGTEVEKTQDEEPEPLSEDQLSSIVDHLRSRPLLGGEEGIRMSLAGAQDKIAVCYKDGVISIPKGGRPTTHILKPFIEGLEGTVENEYFCMKLAAKLGLETPVVTKGRAGGKDFLLVERYDRRTSFSGAIQRLHQEDFCQALSIAPELKYEDEGGPGITKCQNLIQQASRQPAADMLSFQKMLLVHYLVGNHDAHAKNYSFLYRQSVPQLSPLYDVICTAAYPRLSKKLAMSIGGRNIPDAIQLTHWLSLVPDTKAAQRLFVREMQSLGTQARISSDALLKELADQEIEQPILKRIREIIEARASLLCQIAEQSGS